MALIERKKVAYFARDSPCDEDKQPCHTGSVAARVNKDRAFRRAPGRRCQVCYWCIIEDSRKRQHHRRHLEHKDTKSCRETSGTNTRNGDTKWQVGSHDNYHDTFSSFFFFLNAVICLLYLCLFIAQMSPSRLTER